MTEHDDMQERIKRLEERLEQAADEIEYLKARATRTDKRSSKTFAELADFELDMHKRLKEIEEKRLPALRDELKMHRKADEKFTIDFAVQLQLLDRRKKEILQMLRSFRKMVRVLDDEQSSMGLEMRKLTEVYYHVFPERLEPDMKLNKQLRKIFPLPPLPHSKKKRS
ncbi:MAG: hypothetical protein P4L57_10245 [Rhizomicrobium sp.]|nr:hypothetical protein [Rhizomicrobium sp.]